MIRAFFILIILLFSLSFISCNTPVIQEEEKQIEETVKEEIIIENESPIGKMEWKCSNCGYAFSRSVPPDICPGCKAKCQFIDVTCYIPECTGRNLNI